MFLTFNYMIAYMKFQNNFDSELCVTWLNTFHSKSWTTCKLWRWTMRYLNIVNIVVYFKSGKVLEHSNPSVIIFFFTAFAISTIMQCFLYSTFFSKANLAACVAGFLYFIMYLPYTLAVQWEDFMTTGLKVLSVSCHLHVNRKKYCKVI